MLKRTGNLNVLEQELNLYWKTVVDTIQEGVMIVDREGTIVSINQGFENITGYRSGEIIGRRCSVLNCDICRAARDRKGEHWCTLFEEKSISMRRCTLRRKDGSVVPILKNASLFLGEQGRVMGAVETITDISELLEKDSQIEAFRRELRSEDGFHGILGISPAMQGVFDLITNAAQSDAPVIILGESGTGKELVARAIHAIGPRREYPFVKVNCAALTESLLESELFGHVKGAFTGAYRSREGRFEAANGGDIFLDEIGDLPLSTQVKLLRVLEEKIVERVGDNTPLPVDVRVISATNRNLDRLLAEGAYRSDFFFRINVIPITLPPLRERAEDITLLAEAFFRRNQLKSGKKIMGISKEAMDLLLRYEWPGNVRELKSAFEFAFVTCQETMIQPGHLPPNIHIAQERPAANGVNPQGDRQQNQREALIDALRRSHGNRTEAARILGVTRVTVWNRMKKYGLPLTPLGRIA